MRHNKKINHLGRTASHRNAMLSNMASSLILHKKIVTTLAKAKALRKFVEPLITKSKEDSVHSRRTVFSYLQNKIAVKELFLNVAVKIADRPGGYTRILKTGNRLGDNAEMCLIELVDFNELLLSDKGTKKAKSTRRSRSKKTKDDVAVSSPKKTSKPAEEVTEKTESIKEETIISTVEENIETVVEDTKSEDTVVTDTIETSSEEASPEEDKTETENEEEKN